MEETFLIYHDALCLWWSKESQKYIQEKGFEHRQWKCEDPTNRDNRYSRKLVGDSPELCRGLDSHGFADLKRSTLFHTTLSSAYKPDNKKRFNMGTPNEVWRTVVRCWSLEPTSARIIEDISNLPGVLQKVIDAQGCVVQDLYLRTGRRSRRANDKDDLKQKCRSSSRKETIAIPLCHEDCLEALQILNGSKYLKGLQRNQDEETALLEMAKDTTGDFLAQVDSYGSDSSEDSDSTLQEEDYETVSEKDDGVSISDEIEVSEELQAFV
jgi:hypothetical protein